MVSAIPVSYTHLDVYKRQQVFRRENSPYETASFFLGGIEENSHYLFTDADGGEFTLSGKELTKSGFKVDILNKRTAKIYFYKSI